MLHIAFSSEGLTTGSPDAAQYLGWLCPILACQATTFYPDAATDFAESVLKPLFSRNYPVSELSGHKALHSTATILIFLWGNREGDKQLYVQIGVLLGAEIQAI